MEGIHRRSVLPYFKQFCSVPLPSESTLKSVSVEAFLSFVFSVINSRWPLPGLDTIAMITSISGLNLRGRLISHEKLTNTTVGEQFYVSGNLSFKAFLRLASDSPMIIA